MGREIIFEVRENNKTVWPLKGDDMYVCGRDDATTYIAQLIYNQIEEKMDTDKNLTTDDLTDDDYAILLTCNDYKNYISIKNELTIYYNKDMKEIQKAKDTLEDLREARRHASHEDFLKFSDSMDVTEEWIEDNDFSRAGAMIEYLDQCYNKMLDLVNADPNSDRDYIINKYKVAIILSE